MTKREIATAIRSLLQRMSRTELARRLEVSERALSNWTRETKRPRRETVTKIAALQAAQDK